MGWVIKMLIGTSDVCKGGQNPRQMIISSSSINQLKLGDKQNNGIHNDDLALTIRLAHCVVTNCPCAISQWKFCLHISNVTFVAPLKELREMKSHLCVGWKDCRVGQKSCNNDSMTSFKTTSPHSKVSDRVKHCKPFFNPPTSILCSRSIIERLKGQPELLHVLIGSQLKMGFLLHILVVFNQFPDSLNFPSERNVP